jgi:enoyl-CoA hydratase/carnithine racemase
MTEISRVVCEIKGSIATVWLNRPDKLNGLDWLMFEQLTQAAKDLQKNHEIRAVILAAKGDSFCAGLDFRAVQQDKGLIRRLFLKWPWQSDNMAQRVAMCWRRLPVPVIAVVQGNCFGGGLQIALAADFRMAAADARLSVMEIKWGLVPEMSGLVTLSRLVREDVARELAMTGRIVSAQESQQLGLLTHVCDDPMLAAQQLAEQIAARSPDAIVAVKRLFNTGWKSPQWLALWRERWTQLWLLGRYNQRVAVRNGMAKDGQALQPYRNRR